MRRPIPRVGLPAVGQPWAMICNRVAVVSPLAAVHLDQVRPQAQRASGRHEPRHTANSTIGANGAVPPPGRRAGAAGTKECPMPGHACSGSSGLWTAMGQHFVPPCAVWENSDPHGQNVLGGRRNFEIHRVGNAADLSHGDLELLVGHRLVPVTQCVLGVGVYFNHEPIRTGGHRGDG
jgi:hypothetical protein